MASHRFKIGNTFGIGNNGGSPAYYQHPEQLAKKCEEYFEHIQGEWDEEKKEWKKGREPEPATITGLALFLGFSTRQSLLDYAEKPEFADIIKQAKTLVEKGYEINLHGSKPTGSIFALSNMGWKNQQHHDHTTKGEKLPSNNNIITDLTEETLRELASKLPTNKQTDSGNKP